MAARGWLESTVSEDRASDTDAVEAFEKIFGTLSFRTESGARAHVVSWDLASGQVTALAETPDGNLSPGVYRLEDVVRSGGARIDVEGPAGEPTVIRVSGVPEFDWTVETNVVLVTPSGRLSTGGGNGDYPFPGAWGLEARPAWAHVAVISESIYGGDRTVLATATVIEDRKAYRTVGERRSAAKDLNSAID